LTDTGLIARSRPAQAPADAGLAGPALEGVSDRTRVDEQSYPGERPLAGTRAWFALFLGWMIGLVALALFALARSEHGDALALRVWLLALMCFYVSLCNSFLPLPTAWIILLAASPDYALVQTGWQRVGLVAGLGTLATVVANLSEYHLLAYLLRFGLGRRIRRTRVYGWAIRWFDQAPFHVLTLIAFIPIPIDAVRWLAILRGYPRVRFALAYAAGRGPRYLLFAGCSVLLALSAWQILLIQFAMVVAAVLGRLVWGLVRIARRRRVGPAQADQTTLEAAAAGLSESEVGS
jgi:membrane protein YqaA with SNARE-associated domain